MIFYKVELVTRNKNFFRNFRVTRSVTSFAHFGVANRFRNSTFPNLSGKENKDIAEVIINLVTSVKTQSCGVLISRITVRKGKHQNKIQEINDQ